MGLICKYKICEDEFEEYLTPMKAIRKHCLDCSAGLSNEVRNCEMEDCSLYNFRFGKGVSGRIYTDEQKFDIAERFRIARELKQAL